MIKTENKTEKVTKGAKGTKAPKGSLSDWLEDREGSGHKN